MMKRHMGQIQRFELNAHGGKPCMGWFQETNCYGRLKVTSSTITSEEGSCIPFSCNKTPLYYIQAKCEQCGKSWSRNEV